MAAALILAFSLDDLRHAFGSATPPGADPRHDTAAFRAFRAALLDAAARSCSAPAELSFWWEGTFNGYALAVALEPAGAAGELASRLDGICAVESIRIAAPRETRYALGSVSASGAQVALDAEGCAFEAPFGAPAGHFGAPGVRRLR